MEAQAPTTFLEVTSPQKTLQQSPQAPSATDSSSEDSHPEVDARPTLALTKTRKEREAIRKKIYHQRLKDEREALRRSVVDLSKQLEELKHSDNSGLLCTRYSIWRKNALQQRHELHKAQAEQSRLLTAAKSQAVYIKTMCKQLPDITGEFTPDPRIKVMLRGPNCPPFDAAMYRGHVQRVIESYARADEVFQGFSTMEERVLNSVKRRDSDGEVEYLQHLNKFTQPFSFEKTHKTLWELSQFRHRQHDRNDYKGLADPRNALVIRFRLIQELTTGELAVVLQRYVIHRYEEESRVVLVWKTHSEGEGVLSGMHSDETGWIYLRPGLEQDSTEIGVCIRQVPMQFSVSTAGDDIAQEFRRILQNYVNEDMVVMTRALDRMLLEDTLKDINV